MIIKNLAGLSFFPLYPQIGRTYENAAIGVFISYLIFEHVNRRQDWIEKTARELSFATSLGTEQVYGVIKKCKSLGLIEANYDQDRQVTTISLIPSALKI